MSEDTKKSDWKILCAENPYSSQKETVIVDYILADEGNSNPSILEEGDRLYTNALGHGLCAWVETARDPWKKVHKEYEANITKHNLHYLEYFKCEDAYNELIRRKTDPDPENSAFRMRIIQDITNPTPDQIREILKASLAQNDS